MDGSEHVTPAAPAEPGPHPLATALAATLEVASAAPRVLVLGAGSGRNLPPFLAAGARVAVLESNPERAAAVSARFASAPGLSVAHGSYGEPAPFAGGFAAAFSSHALLHGTTSDVARAVAAIRVRLAIGGQFVLTLGSKRDPRFGTGRRVAADTFAPIAGSEAGVAHAFFDAAGVRALLGAFALDDVREAEAGADVGRWAHEPDEAEIIVHWWVRARLAQ
jgi:SAM-dependent methyltransferase